MSETQAERWSWWVGSNDESFHTECATRDEALAKAQKDGGAWVCHAKPGGYLKMSDHIDMDGLIEDMGQSMVENFGNEDGDPILELSDGQMKDLHEALKVAMDIWQQKNGVVCKAWQFACSEPAFYVEATP